MTFHFLTAPTSHGTFITGKKLGTMFHYHMLPQISLVVDCNMALITFVFDAKVEGVDVVLYFSFG